MTAKPYLVLVFAMLWSMCSTVSSGLAQEASTVPSLAKLQATATAMALETERPGLPVHLYHQGNTYYFLPLEKQGALDPQFPGLMLDADSQPVREQALLLELFEYPGLVVTFSQTMSDFNELAFIKAGFLEAHCSGLAGQEEQLAQAAASSAIADLHSTGGNVLLLAGSLVQASVTHVTSFAPGGYLPPLEALVKSLAKEETAARLQAALGSDTSLTEDLAMAFDKAHMAANLHCPRAVAAWQGVSPTGPETSPEHARDATQAVAEMLSLEGWSIYYIKKALVQAGAYPEIVTGLGQEEYDQGMAAMDSLLAALAQDLSFWSQAGQDSSAFVQLWALEQLARVETWDLGGGRIAVPIPGEEWIEPGTNMHFTWIPGGCFTMGCSAWPEDCAMDAYPVHQVCLDGYWMGTYEVGQGEWEAIMGDNPAYNAAGSNFPVERMALEDVEAFLKQLNQGLDDYVYRLPTEAEWEYACTGGGRDERFSGGQDLDAVAWHQDNSLPEGSGPPMPASHERGVLAPNHFGLYDMNGNVAEWGADTYDPEAYFRHEQENPVYTEDTGLYVVRGGSFTGKAEQVNCRARQGADPRLSNSELGFRVILGRPLDQISP